MTHMSRTEVTLLRLAEPNAVLFIRRRDCASVIMRKKEDGSYRITKNLQFHQVHPLIDQGYVELANVTGLSLTYRITAKGRKRSMKRKGKD